MEKPESNATNYREEVEITTMSDSVRRFLNTRTREIRTEPLDLVVTRYGTDGKEVYDPRKPAAEPKPDRPR